MFDPHLQHGPPGAASLDSRLKLHLRVLAVGGHTYRVLSLRPGARVRFSTNFFHHTWHVVTDPRGSRLFARLLWGLAYERHPGTVLVIGGGHLLPTPFEAERSDPILLAPAGFTRLDASAFRLLKRRLRQPGPPGKTVRWRTFGLDRALRNAAEKPVPHLAPQGEDDWPQWRSEEHVWQRERMVRLGGFICYTAPPPVLRLQALRVHAMGVGRDTNPCGMDYHYLAERTAERAYADGEVQIFADYFDRVAAAVQARGELLANPKVPVFSDTLQEEISRRRDQIKGRRLAARR